MDTNCMVLSYGILYETKSDRAGNAAVRKVKGSKVVDRPVAICKQGVDIGAVPLTLGPQELTGSMTGRSAWKLKPRAS